MAEATSITIVELTGLAANEVIATDNNGYKAYMITATSASTSDTLTLGGTSLLGDKISGIAMPLGETYNEAVAATSSTWSSTTITLAGHTGSGRYDGVWLVY